jgi:oligopeptide transport system substrate-binding protein
MRILPENILLDDMPIAPFIYWDIHRFVHNYVKGAEFPLFGPEIEMKYIYTEGRQ